MYAEMGLAEHLGLGLPDARHDGARLREKQSMHCSSNRRRTGTWPTVIIIVARLPLYLPGNGGLLSAVAMMTAGWDGCPDRPAPGFPDNGKWNAMGRA
jgi:hypothetical protein